MERDVQIDRTTMETSPQFLNKRHNILIMNIDRLDFKACIPLLRLAVVVYAGALESSNALHSKVNKNNTRIAMVSRSVKVNQCSLKRNSVNPGGL